MNRILINDNRGPTVPAIYDPKFDQSLVFREKGISWNFNTYEPIDTNNKSTQMVSIIFKLFFSFIFVLYRI